MAVDVAYDGLEAVTKLDVNAYDVVVLDRDLPGLHGDTICRMIADRRQTRHGADADGVRAPPANASAVSASAPTTTWPSRSTSPSSSSGCALSPGASPRPAPGLPRRGMELDPLRHTATRDGRPLDLSVKEFAVLEALMRAEHADPQRRGPPRASLGRARRPLHQDGLGHHQPAPAETRQPPGNRDHPERRIPNRRPCRLSQARHGHDITAARARIPDCLLHAWGRPWTARPVSLRHKLPWRAARESRRSCRVRVCSFEVQAEARSSRRSAASRKGRTAMTTQTEHRQPAPERRGRRVPRAWTARPPQPSRATTSPRPCRRGRLTPDLFPPEETLYI